MSDVATRLSAALADDGVDAVLIVHAPPLADAVDAPVAAIEAAAAGATKPIVIKALKNLSQNDLIVKEYKREFLFITKNAKLILKDIKKYLLMI